MKLKRRKDREIKRDKEVLCAGFVDNFALNACASVLATAIVFGVYTHC